MTPLQHAYLARALQDACGGPDKCVELLDQTPFKMGKTRLYETRDPDAGVTMPIGAVHLLEAHQNWRFYSLTLARAHPAPTEAQCARSEASEAIEVMASVQRTLRLRGAAAAFSENERRELEPLLLQVETRIHGVRLAMGAGARS